MRTRLFVSTICVFISFATSAKAVNVTLDFSLDSNNFFGAGNPDGAAAGAQARATLEAAADFYSSILQDTLAGGSIPDPVPTISNGGSFQWSILFTNPGTGGGQTLSSGVTIAEDEYRVFVGGRPLGGNTLGIGGTGGFSFGPIDSAGNSVPIVSVSPQESALINAGVETFNAGFVDRGEESGFTRWGGAVTFDSDDSIDWHFGLETLPSSGQSDFFSVALHELGHALGFGGSSEWNDLVVGEVFTGAASTSVFGEPPPTSPGHWAEDIASTVLGTTTPQETAFDPTILQGTRKLVTTLDAASLVDIGWEIDLTVATLPGDYNGDLTVNAADYVIWRSTAGTPEEIGSFEEWSTNFGAGTTASLRGATTFAATAVPEPSTAVLAVSLLAAAGLRRKR